MAVAKIAPTKVNFIFRIDRISPTDWAPDLSGSTWQPPEWAPELVQQRGSTQPLKRLSEFWQICVPLSVSQRDSRLLLKELRKVRQEIESETEKDLPGPKKSTKFLKSWAWPYKWESWLIRLEDLWCRASAVSEEEKRRLTMQHQEKWWEMERTWEEKEAREAEMKELLKRKCHLSRWTPTSRRLAGVVRECEALFAQWEDNIRSVCKSFALARVADLT